RLSVLMADDEISQAMETRLDSVINAPWRFKEDHREQTEFLKEQVAYWHNEIITGAWEACPFGYSVMEANYKILEDGRFTLNGIQVKPLEWFEPKNNGELIYREPQANTEINVFQKWPLKFFLTRRKPSFKQPYGDPLLSKLYWLWFFRTNSTKFWVKFLERFGSPLLVGKVGGNSRTQDDIDAMTSALLNAHSQSVISIGSEDDVNTVGTNFSGAGSSAFEAFDTVLTRRIQKVVLGQTLTSGTDGTGSRALGEVHENVRKDKLNADIRLVTPTFQAIVDALCALNGWGKHEIILGENSKQLNKDQAERDVKLKDAGAVFTNQYFIREYGLQEGDLAEPLPSQTPQPQFQAIPSKPFSFAASVKDLTQEQQELDELADPKIQLFSEAVIKDLIANSTGIEDMRD
ncbi:MAG: DUF935 family protein, partial [Acinetobacter sp.]